MKKNQIVLTVITVCIAASTVFYVYYEKRMEDTNSPSFEFASEILSESINADDEMLKSGVRAIDPEEGDISDSILIENIEIDKANVEDNQLFNITYAAFDSAGNSSEVTQKLIFTDYHSPHFKLSRPLVFTEGSSITLLDYFTAEDVLDGDITPFITVEGDNRLSEYSLSGNYTCTLSVRNSVGDTASLSVPVYVIDGGYMVTDRPSLFLTKYLIYLKQGEHFDPMKYLDYVEDDGFCRIDYEELVPLLDEKGNQKRDENGEDIFITQKELEGSTEKWVHISDITAEHAVDTKKKGTYIVQYTYKARNSSPDQNEHTCDTYLLVIVE